MERSFPTPNFFTDSDRSGSWNNSCDHQEVKGGVGLPTFESTRRSQSELPPADGGHGEEGANNGEDTFERLRASGTTLNGERGDAVEGPRGIQLEAMEKELQELHNTWRLVGKKGTIDWKAIHLQQQLPNCDRSLAFQELLQPAGPSGIGLAGCMDIPTRPRRAPRPSGYQAAAIRQDNLQPILALETKLDAGKVHAHGRDPSEELKAQLANLQEYCEAQDTTIRSLTAGIARTTEELKHANADVLALRKEAKGARDETWETRRQMEGDETEDEVEHALESAGERITSDGASPEDEEACHRAKGTLMIFDIIRRLHCGNNHSKAYTLMSKELHINTKNQPGAPPGVGVGSVFHSRHEMAVVGLAHKVHERIHYAQLSGVHPDPLALAVVVDLDGDGGDDIILYKGSNKEGQGVANLTHGNAAMVQSKELGIDVRVIRCTQIKPRKNIYTYIGLYNVINWWWTVVQTGEKRRGDFQSFNGETYVFTFELRKST